MTAITFNLSFNLAVPSHGSYPPGRHHQATFPPRVEQSFTVRWLALSVSPGCIFTPSFRCNFHQKALCVQIEKRKHFVFTKAVDKECCSTRTESAANQKFRTRTIPRLPGLVTVQSSSCIFSFRIPFYVLPGPILI